MTTDEPPPPVEAQSLDAPAARMAFAGDDDCTEGLLALPERYWCGAALRT